MPIEAKRAEPFYTAIIAKEFSRKKEAGGWKHFGCPLGEGMVNRACFDRLKQTAYRGLISQHHEYNVGEGSRRIASLQHDLKVLKEWLA